MTFPHTGLSFAPCRLINGSELRRFTARGGRLTVVLPLPVFEGAGGKSQIEFQYDHNWQVVGFFT